MFVFSDKPSGAGAFNRAFDYQTKTLSGGGIIVDTSRAIIESNAILNIGLRDDPSLLCTCDAYLANPLLANGTLYTIIPE